MSAPHEWLNEAMRRRSVDLRKRWVDIAKEADITVSALGGIRRGEYKPSPHTARALEDALRWKPGSVEAILAGGDPTPAEQVEPPTVLQNLRVLVETNPAAAQAINDLIESIQRGPQPPEPSQPPQEEPDERRDIG